MVDFGCINQACLDSFGQALVLTRQTGQEVPFQGILMDGAEAEEAPPGDGSVYAIVWTKASLMDLDPETGDEVASGAIIYKIFRIDKDSGGGLILSLRQNRVLEY